MNYDGRWKYIQNRFDIGELYDLKTDPDEMQNFANHSEHQSASIRCDGKSLRWFAIQAQDLMTGGY